jgi:glycosyltransferase involved in cell wall biosynthesis
MFFSVLQKLKKQNIPFKLSVIGEQFKNSPEIFDKAKETFDDNIINWGYISSYSEYQKVLTTIDILVSTADHEFFGVSVMEAIDAGVYPLLPQKLSYPELLQLNRKPKNNKFFYDGSEIDLKNNLINIIDCFNNGTVSFNLQEIANQYYWSIMGTKLDNALKKLL